MIDMKNRAAVLIGDAEQLVKFVKNVLNITEGDYFTENTDIDEMFRFLFPFARLMSLQTYTGSPGYNYFHYAIFRCEEDATEFKLKYMS